MTWKECKQAALAKMFCSGEPDDDATQEYLAAMPQVANEGLQLLATAGKFIRGCYEVELSGSESASVWDLQTICPDFYSADPLACYLEGADGVPQPLRQAQVLEGRWLLAPPRVRGKLLFFYNRWPVAIMATTPDEEALPLDGEVAVLLPLYIASQLYKDDDMGMATAYRNEFEVGRDALRQTSVGVLSGEFTSASGWLKEG